MDNIKIYGNPNANKCIIRLTGEHEKELIESEIELLKKEINDDGWCVILVPIIYWEDDLAPWATHARCEEEYKTGAEDTLQRIVEEYIPKIETDYPVTGRDYYLAGYSLAGLFTLWAAYQTDRFTGIVAASPSVWYPGWLEYIKDNQIKTDNVYLSLGSKEHKTRNQMMAKVRDNITFQYDLLKEDGINVFFELNEGNHFKDTIKRMAKGIAYIIKTDTKM